MVSDERVERAVEDAKTILKALGVSCSTSAADLKAWFEAETPFEDGNLDDVMNDRLIVVHELVEIDEVKKMGLRIDNRTIVDNLEKVDIAHLRATRVELKAALSLGDRRHIETRLPDIEKWICDSTVTPSQKKEYKELLSAAKKMVEKASPVGRKAYRSR